MVRAQLTVVLHSYATFHCRTDHHWSGGDEKKMTGGAGATSWAQPAAVSC